MKNKLKELKYMDRNFSLDLLSRIIKDSIEVRKDLSLYYCCENVECWPAIKRNIRVVEEYEITPEKYWHRSTDEFEWLLTLLSSDYPSPKTLLNLAKKETNGEIKDIADHYFQHVNVMFEHVKNYKGYVVLRPSSFMQSLYPSSKNMLYVYTTDKWANQGLSDIDGEFLIFCEDRLNDLPVLITERFNQVLKS